MPHFSETLKERFLSGQSNQFILYGNVQDLYPFKENYTSLLKYLNHFLEDSGRFQIHYNIGGGIRFFKQKNRDTLKKAYIADKNIGGTPRSKADWFDKVLLESAFHPQVGIKFIDECLKLESPKDKALNQFSIIIDYAEMLAPSGPSHSLNDSDRQKLVVLSEWLTSPKFINSFHLVIFICDSLASISPILTELPSMTLINIPRPTQENRLDFIRNEYHEHEKKIKIKGSQTKMSFLTAGLTLKGIKHLFLSAGYRETKLDEKQVLEKTNEILGKELGNAIEIFKPKHDFKAVIGASKIKDQLKRQIKLIKLGVPSICPVGILVSGPNGVGKTFIFEAFAKEVGFIAIKLKKIRGQFFGQTDVIFEKLKSVLTSLGKVVIFIDEADTAFGGRGEGTHETEKRLFGNLIQMMGDPANRGKVIWILITARPDKLEPDVKRSGRAGLHLPIFDPEGEERQEFILWILKRVGLEWPKWDPKEQSQFLEITKNFSPADFNEWGVLIESEIRLNKGKLDPKAVFAVTRDFRPADIVKERRYQSLLAAKECSFYSLLPDEFKDDQMVHSEIKKLYSEMR